MTRQSWLKVQLAGLYSTEFKRLREEFETATASAASLVSKCKDLNTVLRTEEDADRQRVLQNEINDSKCLAEGENKLVRELNIRMSVLKGQLDHRLLKVDEKGSCHLLARFVLSLFSLSSLLEAAKSALLQSLEGEELKVLGSSIIDRMFKVLFIPSLDKKAEPFTLSKVEMFYIKSFVSFCFSLTTYLIILTGHCMNHTWEIYWLIAMILIDLWHIRKR